MQSAGAGAARGGAAGAGAGAGAAAAGGAGAGAAGAGAGAGACASAVAGMNAESAPATTRVTKESKFFILSPLFSGHALFAHRRMTFSRPNAGRFDGVRRFSLWKSRSFEACRGIGPCA